LLSIGDGLTRDAQFREVPMKLKAVTTWLADR
jgi:hypothetical protein